MIDKVRQKRRHEQRNLNFRKIFWIPKDVRTCSGCYNGWFSFVMDSRLIFISSFGSCSATLAEDRTRPRIQYEDYVWPDTRVSICISVNNVASIQKYNSRFRLKKQYRRSLDFLLLTSSDRKPKRFLQKRISENPTRFRSETVKSKRSIVSIHDWQILLGPYDFLERDCKLGTFKRAIFFIFLKISYQEFHQLSFAPIHRKKNKKYFPFEGPQL